MGIKKILTWIMWVLFVGLCSIHSDDWSSSYLASTGNASQAGLTYFTNKAVEKETGMDTVTYVSKKIEQQSSRTKLKRELKNLVEANFVKTREKLILQDKSKIFN